MSQAEWIVNQAKKDVDDAKQQLAIAKDSKSKQLISQAEEALAKAEKTLAQVSSKNENKAGKAQDRWLSEQYRQLGPMVAQLVQSDKELARLFRRAVDEEWDADTFQYELKNNTDWWDSKSAPWRKAFELESTSGDKEWQRQLSLAGDEVRRMASEYGIQLSKEDAAKLARQYHYQGWADTPELMQSRFAQLAKKAPQDERTKYNSVEQLVSELAGYARDFGMSYDDGWLRTTAIKLMDPRSGLNMNQVMQQMAGAAESRYPAFKGKLGYGSGSGDGQTVTTLRDAAGDYVGLASQLLEVQAKDIDLSDGMFRKAFNAGEGEQPKMMSLYDFENEVRNDPRWAKTKNAEDAAMANVNKVLSMFGMTG